jgi:uncharacterized protein YjdB
LLRALTASEDITVIAAISETVLGKVDYSTIPVDYDKDRSWTASLIASNGQVFATQTTSGDIIAFPVEAKDNTGGKWRVRIDSAAGFLDKQLFFTMVVTGLRNIGGSGPGTPGGNHIPVTGITLAPTSADLTPGATLQLTPSIIPSNATSQDVAWSTLSPDVATVENGTVTAVAAGTAKITVTTVDGGHVAESLITVRSVFVPVTGILVTPAALQLKEDEHGVLSVIFSPVDATNKNVTWETSDASVATVSNGTVTAKGEGMATITATAEDGSRISTCTVTVTKKGGGTDSKQEHYENKYPGKNVIIAPDGSGEVYGTAGDDVIVSGSGDDWLEGGEGSDVYVYEAGSGDDVISNVSNGENDEDELHFGPGIWPEDLTFAREADDLVVRILDGMGGYAGNVTVEDWYLDEKNKLLKIVFDNGTELTLEEIEALAATPPNVLRGTTGANVLRTSSPASGSVIVYGLVGLDTIYGGAGTDIIVPGIGNDVIYTRATLEGGGKKVFWLNAGDGNDTVYYLNAAHEPGDGLGILRFGNGIAPEDVEIRNSGNNVVFALTGGSARVTFMEANRGDVRYQLDEIRFSDGTTLAWQEAAQQRIVRGTEIGEALLASSRAGESVTVYGLGGLDTIYGGGGDDTLVSGPGNDVVYARSTIEGGGQKTFVWNIGDGNDTVYYINTDHQPGDGLGVLSFGSGIDPEDVEVRNSGNNVIVALIDGSGSVTFISANREDPRYQPDRICFSNGETWEWSEAAGRKVVRGTNAAEVLRTSSLAGENVTVYGLGGLDTIYGGAGDDTFVPGPGNDVVYARSTVEGGGQKTFVWNTGDGNDTVYYIKAETERGILKFGSGIGPEDVEVRNNVNNVVFALSDGSGGITFINANTTDVRCRLEEIQFSDGTVWAWSEAAERRVVRGTSIGEVLRAASHAGDKVVVYGLEGLDTLYGGSGEDTFVPGAGNDVVYARSNLEGGGKKIFRWNAGDGNDTIHYYNANHQAGDGLGVVIFGSGINLEDVELQNSGNNVMLVVTLTNGKGNITFIGANRGDVRYQPDELRFSDGSVLEWADAVTRKVVRGTASANILLASSYAGEKVAVYGLGGLDTIYGGSGDDTFVPGAGNDVIYARSTLEGGGQKTFVWNPGDGNDTIYYLNASHVAGDGMGALRFGSGIAPSDVTVQTSGSNIVFNVMGGKVTFMGANTDVYRQVDKIYFSDGVIWQWSTMPR